MAPRAPDPVERARQAPEARAERKSRALEELLDVRPSLEGPPGVLALEVRNLRRQSRYTVFVPAYPDRTGAFCGCVDFARRDLGTCKHVEAAWLWLGDHPEAFSPRTGTERPTELWASIERRARRSPPASASPSARLRFLGEPLLGAM